MVMMRGALRSLWSEPSATNPPTRVWRDWAVFTLALVALALEALLRQDLVWVPAAVVLGIGLAFTLLWRRTHPLAMLATAFGAITALDVAAVSAAGQPVELFSAALVLILVYSLFRWASGRDTAIGGVIMLAALVSGSITNFTGFGDLIGGAMVLMFPAVLGIEIRHQFIAQRQRVEQSKLQEREQLARELHDAVAHHVSAIAIQAQAGRFLAESSSLDGAAAALKVIEEEASRALVEMRTMIGILRDRDIAPDMAPRRGIADIKNLASTTTPNAPQIDVEFSGDLDNLQPPVEAAVYRLAQESITNAIRHARHVSRVEVRIAGHDDMVSLTVTDNGDASSATANPPGYGLVGMTERATLLGGSFEAGPGPDRGWTVHAVLPRGGPAR